MNNETTINILNRKTAEEEQMHLWKELTTSEDD